MTRTPDLVIRGGTIADGKGGELFEGDVAITGGRITEVGKVAAKGKEEIDARGKLVTPGFVDVHPLRRPGRLEPGHHAVVAERRHDSDHGQLRRRLRAVQAVRPCPADPADGRRRGYSGTGAE